VPEPGETDNVWWFGFDCAHAQDYIPAMHKVEIELVLAIQRSNALPMWLKDKYRDQAYAMHEVEQLAEQLVARASPTG
jgi:hypothetical protein